MDNDCDARKGAATALKEAKSFVIGEDTPAPVTAGGDRPFLIAGPCVIESEAHTLELAKAIAAIAAERKIPYIFKASFDKANRTSIDSYRGPGMEEGLRILAKVRKEVGVPVLTDFHGPAQAGPVAAVVDVLQIPAFLCRQTDILVEAAKTGKTVNIKKGQFLAPGDIVHAVRKAEASGAEKIMLTERGASFGYNNLVTDPRSLAEMAKLGWPIIFDATHSVQTPGGAGSSSGGTPEFIAPLVRAAVAVGVSGVFMEVHGNPAEALSDGANALDLKLLPTMIDTILEIDAARRRCS